MPQRGHGLLVVGRSDIAHELHDQSRVPERAGDNDEQSASERRDRESRRRPVAVGMCRYRFLSWPLSTRSLIGPMARRLREHCSEC
jgi:hypothetical protein